MKIYNLLFSTLSSTMQKYRLHREKGKSLVQFAEANKIEARWIAAGSPYCEHPNIDKEYDLGMDSGDKRCLSCGDTFTRPEWKAGDLKPRGVKP